MSPPISIHVTVTFSPDDAPTFVSAITRARSVAKELPEFISFELFRNPEIPGQFKYVEKWDASLEWLLKAAAENQAIREYFEATEKLYVKPREMEVWEFMEAE